MRRSNWCLRAPRSLALAGRLESQVMYALTTRTGLNAKIWGDPNLGRYLFIASRRLSPIIPVIVKEPPEVGL